MPAEIYVYVGVERLHCPDGAADIQRSAACAESRIYIYVCSVNIEEYLHSLNDLPPQHVVGKSCCPGNETSLLYLLSAYLL